MGQQGRPKFFQGVRRNAKLYAPTQITLGASEASAKTAPFFVYEVAVRTSEGWRIASIVPVPAQ